MYQNILKKAAAPKKAQKTVWRRYAALAACLVLVCTAGFFALRGEKRTPVQDVPTDTEFSQPPMMGVSPFEDVSGPADFEPLGFTIDAPEGATDVTYCIAYGNTAQVSFTRNGCEYCYEASKEEVFSETAEETPKLTGVDAVWKKADVQYRLRTDSCIATETLLQLAELLSQN